MALCSAMARSDRAQAIRTGRLRLLEAARLCSATPPPVLLCSLRCCLDHSSPLRSTVLQEEYIKEEQKNLKNELLRAQEEVKRIQVGARPGGRVVLQCCGDRRWVHFGTRCLPDARRWGTPAEAYSLPGTVCQAQLGCGGTAAERMLASPANRRLPGQPPLHLPTNRCHLPPLCHGGGAAGDWAVPKNAHRRHLLPACQPPLFHCTRRRRCRW